MILLSAHKDLVMNNYRFEYKDGEYIGLLDNTIGVLVCNSLMLEEPNIVKLEKQKKVSLFFGSGEEWGLHDDFPKLTKKDIVIVVDVCSGNEYKGLDFSLENISGISVNKINTLKENLIWEGFKLRNKKYNGSPDLEDEAYSWHELGIPVLSFIIPIENGSKETGWHNDDCTITIEKLSKAKQGLKRTLNYLL
jgi:hypothetical protein